MAGEGVGTVGVIGLGIIGKPIALRLVDAGFQVFVYDVRAEPVAALAAAGATACGSPAEVAKASEIVISLVSDAKQTHDVVFGGEGVLGAMARGSIFVIGKPIALRIVAAGFEVFVYDVRAEPVGALTAAGAKACASPAEIARASEIVISLVSDAKQTHDVVFGSDGVLERIARGSIFVTGSTLGPSPVREVADALRAKGVATLDAPISGGYLAAAEGKLSVMVGGAPETLDRAMPVLRAFAQSVTRAGDVGAGQSAKLAHQLVCSVNVMTLLEGLALGVAGGVEPEVLKRIFREGIADSAVLRLWGDLAPRWKGMLAATPPDVTPPNLRKDLHLALEYARELGVNLYVGTQASLIADSGNATGRDDPRL